MCILVFCEVQELLWTQKTPWNRGVGCQGKLISEGKNRYIYIHTIGVGDFFFLPPPPLFFFSKFERFKPVILGLLISHRKKKYKNCYPKSQTRFQYSKIGKLIKLKSYSLTRTGRGIAGTPLRPFSHHILSSSTSASSLSYSVKFLKTKTFFPVIL